VIEARLGAAVGILVIFLARIIRGQRWLYSIGLLVLPSLYALFALHAGEQAVGLKENALRCSVLGSWSGLRLCERPSFSGRGRCILDASRRVRLDAQPAAHKPGCSSLVPRMVLLGGCCHWRLSPMAIASCPRCQSSPSLRLSRVPPGQTSGRGRTWKPGVATPR
jgi:hypothetical protein